MLPWVGAEGNVRKEKYYRTFNDPALKQVKGYMADNEDVAPESDEFDEERPAKGKKGLILIVLMLVLLAGGGAAAYFLFFAGESSETEVEMADSEGATEGEGGTTVVPGKPVYYALPEFLVNLSSTRKQPSFLKMKVTLELASAEDQKVIEENLPRIKDMFNGYLRELRASDLTGTAGMNRLREEMLLRLNQTIAPSKANNILFEDILVQ